jgi:glycosyltransferase involved in cell wall biosynthesis
VITVQNNTSFNLRVRYGIDSNPSFFDLLKHWLKSKEVRLLYRQADEVVAVSEGVKKNLVNSFGLSKQRIRVITNLVNVHKVQNYSKKPVDLPSDIRENTPLIVAMGRMVPQKGYADMLHSFALIRKQRTCQLIILGEGPLREDLEALASTLEIGADLYMLGFVENPWAYIRKADLFLSSSHWEGFSLAHLEAMACGTPLVLTDCDYGPREIIDNNNNGVLVPVGNPEKMADAILRLLADSDKRQKMAQRARLVVEYYSRSAILKKYDLLFQGMLDRNCKKTEVSRSHSSHDLAENAAEEYR